jgi:hypothetical protein
MRLMSQAHARVMNQLVRLAYRDSRLVDAALKHCARDDGTADLEEVIAFIKRHRVVPTPASRRNPPALPAT